MLPRHAVLPMTAVVFFIIVLMPIWPREIKPRQLPSSRASSTTGDGRSGKCLSPSRNSVSRAYAKQGNRENSRKAYDVFFTGWRDADPDIPILRQARAEYKKLTATPSVAALASMIFLRLKTASNRNMGSIKTGRKLLKTGDRGAF